MSWAPHLRKGSQACHFDQPLALKRSDRRQFLISPLEEADLIPLAGLYRQVWIRRDNYRQLLDPAAPDNFARTGGMFLIQDAAGLAHLLEDPTEFVWVAREAGRLVGGLWCGLADTKYDDLASIRPRPGHEALVEQIQRGLADQTLYFSKEILVAPDQHRSLLPEALLLNAMRFFQDLGYRQSCGEVYHVHALLDGGTRRPVDLCNTASARMLTRTGCQTEGEFLPRLLHGDGFAALISMQIVRWELGPALEQSHRLLEQAGATLER